MCVNACRGGGVRVWENVNGWWGVMARRARGGGPVPVQRLQPRHLPRPPGRSPRARVRRPQSPHGFVRLARRISLTCTPTQAHTHTPPAHPPYLRCRRWLTWRRRFFGGRQVRATFFDAGRYKRINLASGAEVGKRRRPRPRRGRRYRCRRSSNAGMIRKQSSLEVEVCWAGSLAFHDFYWLLANY